MWVRGLPGDPARLPRGGMKAALRGMHGNTSLSFPPEPTDTNLLLGNLHCLFYMYLQGLPCLFLSVITKQSYLMPGQYKRTSPYPFPPLCPAATQKSSLVTPFFPQALAKGVHDIKPGGITLSHCVRLCRMKQ